jgi:hypothetical protein
VDLTLNVTPPELLVPVKVGTVETVPCPTENSQVQDSIKSSLIFLIVFPCSLSDRIYHFSLI